MEKIRSWVKRTPVLRDVARWILRRWAEVGGSSFNSADYWETRYSKGRNSGPGSYSRLAAFKADVINDFVRDRNIQSVIELGCGDGAQLQQADYPAYTGVDVSRTVLQSTSDLFKDDPSKRFLHLDDVTDADQADLAMSLDVIYHLVEDKVFEQHMNLLFRLAKRYAIIYASNEDRPVNDIHVRHRKFTDWIERNQPSFHQVKMIKNPYPEDLADPDNTSFADFYFFERR